MTSDEVWDLLELIASIDRRKVGLTDRQTWRTVSGDLPPPTRMAAVTGDYADSTDWLMPAHVRTRVKAMRRYRLAREIVPAPPPRSPTTRPASGSDQRPRPRDRGWPRSPRPSPVRFARTTRRARGRRLGRSFLPAPALTPQEIALQQAAESRAAREDDEGEPAA